MVLELNRREVLAGLFAAGLDLPAAAQAPEATRVVVEHKGYMLKWPTWQFPLDGPEFRQAVQWLHEHARERLKRGCRYEIRLSVGEQLGSFNNLGWYWDSRFAPIHPAGPGGGPRWMPEGGYYLLESGLT